LEISWGFLFTRGFGGAKYSWKVRFKGRGRVWPWGARGKG